jgi:hypothetical protein
MFVYIVYRQRECDDPYYAPYTDVLAVYRSEEAAVEKAKAYAEKWKEDMTRNDCFYVIEHSFADEGVGKGLTRDVFVIDKDGTPQP